MKYFEPVKLKNGNFLFQETLDGGYLNRGSRWTNTIVSEWTKDLKLVKFTINDKDDLYFFDKNGKLRKDIKIPEKEKLNSNGDANFALDNRIAIRAKNRHLKYLKIYLGIEKVKEKKTVKVIYRNYSWWSNKIKIAEKELTKKGTPNFGNCRYIRWIKWTPEKEKLVKELNAKIKEMEQWKSNMTIKIFGKFRNK